MFRLSGFGRERPLPACALFAGAVFGGGLGPPPREAGPPLLRPALRGPRGGFPPPPRALGAGLRGRSLAFRLRRSAFCPPSLPPRPARRPCPAYGGAGFLRAGFPRARSGAERLPRPVGF